MNEYKLVEKPAVEQLEGLGYEPVSRQEIDGMRADESSVLLRERLVAAVERINDVPRETAEVVYGELMRLRDNETWFERLRGQYSKKPAGEKTSRTIRLLDFDEPENNDWVVTRQMRVAGPEKTIKPDLVVFVNGIPVVVLEAKHPDYGKEGWEEGAWQIERYQQEAPRLFDSNVFNIATNDISFRYAATGAPRQYWFRWPDPWPRDEKSFGGGNDEMQMGLWATLEPSRLLDLIAHFVVFERDPKTEQVVKKICRYQQFRATNKLVKRVLSGEARKGLVWHTQGSGKSLTMVFSALKLKYQRGVDAGETSHGGRLSNPNLMVVTDRRDLDKQITKTFRACGLPNPKHAGSIKELQAALDKNSPGRTVLSTIFRFDQEDERLRSGNRAERRRAVREMAVEDSDRWVLLVDECHRTQEELLGAYLRATLPDAHYFGFTGTPVKKHDKNTFQNFGASGEQYMDKYGIQDAVDDEATVPVKYTARLPEFHLEERELDVAFDQMTARLDEEVVEALKERGVTKGDLARFGPRIELIARDIWEHYRNHVQPDGYKAQLVAIDRKAVVEYKKALDVHIAKFFEKREGLSPMRAQQKAAQLSAPIYSKGQNDVTKHPEVAHYQLSESEQKRAIEDFLDADHELSFLIVCDKLLTGFDAPVEQAMYLDKPLRDHNLLQAIARTNRRFEDKPYGLIVDYYGISDHLGEALSAYRQEDVAGAMEPEDGLLEKLEQAHRRVMVMIDQEHREDPKAAVEALGSEDQWLGFRRRADVFLELFGALVPDQRALEYQYDAKLVGAMMPYGKNRWEQEEGDVDFRQYSEKIRGMLKEHLEVTGIRSICELKSLSDPTFWQDFEEGPEEPEELKTAAVRKVTELKKVISDKEAENESRYERFSERIKELIEALQMELFDAAEMMEKAEELARDLEEEEQAHRETGLNREAHGVLRILEEGIPAYDAESAEAYEEAHDAAADERLDGTELKELAREVDELYRSEELAPPRWHEKKGMRKTLRSEVRRRLYKAGVENWKNLTRKIDAFAVDEYRRV